MRHSFIRSFLLFALLFSKSAFSQTILSKELDSTSTRFSKSTDPGFAVAVVQHGNIKYKRAFGMADLPEKRRNMIVTPFNIASASKQFTAASIYLLEQQGKLRTSDKLSKYFPDFPSYADTITIAHLIHHQSGLRDYVTLFALRIMDENSVYGDTEAYALLAQQKALNFKPGDKYDYSNSGYFLLSLIVKKVSGQDLQVFAYNNIFKPLKMYHTGFSHSHKVAAKANAYVFDGKKFNEYNPKESTIGHSHVYSPVTDWQMWFKEMKDHKLLGDAVWAKMLRPASTNDGKVTEYAGGLIVGNYKEKTAIYHEGDLYGYHSKMIWFPREDLGIIILTNKEGVSPETVLGAIYNSMYKSAKQEVPLKTELTGAKPPIKIDTNRYLGSYQDNGNVERNFEVIAEDSKLRINQFWNQTSYPIAAANDSLFYIEGLKGITFTFRDTIGGKATKILILQNDKLTPFTRLKNWNTIDPKTIQEYVGRYDSEEINANYTVYEDAGKLKIKMGEMKLNLIRTGKKENYNIEGIGMSLLFHRNKDGKIDGMDVSHPRALGLQFAKKGL